MTQQQAEDLARKHMPAFDVLLADRVPAEKAADIVAACVRDGKDPLAFAKHFVTLRKATRGES